MSKKPNVLYLITDEQRVDSLGEGGAPWASTPHLDAFARSGTRFSAAYTPSPVCVSARAALVTGRACSTVGVLNNHHLLTDAQARFLPPIFADAGYQVASFGKHHYNNPQHAFATQVDRVLGDRVSYSEYHVEIDEREAGVVHYPADEHNRAFPWILAGRFPGSAEETAEGLTCADAAEWLRQRDPDRPFFLRLSFNAPHTPVVAPAPFHDAIDPTAIDLPIDGPDDLPDLPLAVREYLIHRSGSHRLTADQIRRTRQCYYGRVSFVDHLFGQLFEQMRALGALDNTIVAFTSDHGAHLGDHGFYQKQSFFDASARVPLFLSGPGIPGGVVVDAPVSIGSLLPTLLDLADIGAPENLDYASLTPAFHGTPADDPVFSEIDYGLWDYRDGDRYVMIRHNRWKLALYRDPTDPERLPIDDSRTLYDLETDPGERRNLSGDPAYAEIAEDLTARIDAWDRSRTITPPKTRKPTKL
ncbi:MAG: sulfatase-like hydrolase/transferase [Gemmatimonadetes bacterium]|jgi:arylsulfatase A-like enzyme|nr:sulfatase-like hydrolase/transferase [Gemmatimonadota bacterium]